jgi:hypothetical protein
MRLKEFERSGRRPLFEVPAHLYKQALLDACSWAGNLCLGRTTKAFEFENRLRFFAGFFAKRRKDFLAGRNRSDARELLEFARSLAHRKGDAGARAEG